MSRTYMLQWDIIISSLSASQFLGHEALSRCVRHPPASHTAALQAPIWQQCGGQRSTDRTDILSQSAKTIWCKRTCNYFCQCFQVLQAPAGKACCKLSVPSSASVWVSRVCHSKTRSNTCNCSSCPTAGAAETAPASPETKRVICITFLGSTATFLSANSHSLVWSWKKPFSNHISKWGHVANSARRKVKPSSSLTPFSRVMPTNPVS